jgi:GT2 family glycosyltransferase
MIDVIILSYSANESLKSKTRDCLDSLMSSEKNSEDTFNILVLESQNGIKWDNGTNIKTIDPPLPYGYHKFMNFGRKMGKNKYICLCNNDLIFNKNWASQILSVSENNKEIMSFSPLCPKTQPLYGIKPNSGNYIGYEVRKHISGWCIFQRKEIYDRIGDLDERYRHWFSDNDYALTLYTKKIPHCLVTSSIVEHHDKNIGETGTTVLNENDLWELTDGSGKIFREKWKQFF